MSMRNLLKHFQDKSRWLPTEGGGNVSDVNTLSAGSPATVDHKRSHQFYSDANELPPSKKQAIQVPITKPDSWIKSNGLPSESAFGFHSSPDHYIDRLLGSQPKLIGENVFAVGMSSSYDKIVDTGGQYQNGSHLNNINMVEVHGNRLLTHVGHNVNMWGSRKIDISTKEIYGQKFGFADFAPTGCIVGQSHHSKIGFAKFAPATPRIRDSKVYNDVKKALEMPVSSYSLLYEPHLIPASEMLPSSKKGRKKKGDAPNGNTMVSLFRQSKPGPGRPPKAGRPPKPGHQSDNRNKSEKEATNKSEKKATKKEGTPQKFLPNVRSLTATGMFDGVQVLYMSPRMSQSKELPGIIKGPNYLCGCPSCNFSKEVSAIAFERHAGFKTSHPNNHIHFPNGKSMHQVVQELNNTPELMLFDAVKNVTGFAINGKAFLIWKESCKTANGKSQDNSGTQQLRLCSNENAIQM